MKAQIVVDLGFGDAGKGITTDYLCSKSSNPIVVRFSGGQQAGHTVILDGKKHIHSSYGSGTLRGVPSYFSEHCTFSLNAMHNEFRVLREIGINPKLFIHPLAKVTTPYDIAYNRVRERQLGHGSCGWGIAATMKRNLETGYKLTALDMQYPEIFRQKLLKIKEYYASKTYREDLNLKQYDEEVAMNESNFIKLVPLAYQMFTVANYDMLENYEDLIFEGSQGIMLDMDHGIFPHVTFANTTSKNALEICSKLSPKYPNDSKEVEVFYVTRCYQTRHGAGWMSNNQQIELINNKEEINVHNEWQMNFRIGELDYDLLNYAIEVDTLYAPRLQRNLVVTCLDQRPDFKFDVYKMDFHLERVFHSYSPESKDFKLL
jgi:adenylosuccinate synthase